RHTPWKGLDRFARWPVPPALRSSVAGLCFSLEERISRNHQGLHTLIRQQVEAPLGRSDLVGPVSRAADVSAGATGAHQWYGTLSVNWVARFDALREVVDGIYTGELSRRLDLWVAALTSSGPWWPREDVCVVAERPSVLHTEVWGEHGEPRLHGEDGPAIRYADGWDLYAWHGTRVPSWVVTEPDVPRIERETNVEIRRCAIERMGWGAYADAA
ncbi:DUF6745 domain-containing protein, partial [Actinomadura adrarensis]